MLGTIKTPEKGTRLGIIVQGCPLSGPFVKYRAYDRMVRQPKSKTPKHDEFTVMLGGGVCGSGSIKHHIPTEHGLAHIHAHLPCAHFTYTSHVTQP